MSLLDKLWDDTVAGPLPDSGLGRLRKPRPKDADASPPEHPQPRVTRSITIRRPAPRSPPPSPAAACGTPPHSPFSGSGGREWNRFRRKPPPAGGACEAGSDG